MPLSEGISKCDKNFLGWNQRKKTSLLTIPLWKIPHRLLPGKELPSGYYVIYSEVNWHFLHYMVQVTLFEKLLEVLGRSTSSVPEHVYHINLRSWGKNKTECCCKKQCKPSTISLHWEYKNFRTFTSILAFIAQHSWTQSLQCLKPKWEALHGAEQVRDKAIEPQRHYYNNWAL